MRKVRWMLGLALLAGAGLLLAQTTPVTAGDKPKDTKEGEKRGKLTKKAKSVQDIAMAYQLIEYGRRAKSAEALIVAAQILHANPTKKGEEKPKGDDGDKGMVNVKGLQPKALIAEAKALSSDKHIAALVEAAEEKVATKAKGALNPKRYSGYLAPKQSKNYFITFKGGEQAIATVIGTTSADVDLFIYTDEDQSVTSDTRIYNWAICNWFVPSTRIYRIRVLNFSSDQATSYTLVTN